MTILQYTLNTANGVSNNYLRKSIRQRLLQLSDKIRELLPELGATSTVNQTIDASPTLS